MEQDVVNYLNMTGGALDFLNKERTLWEKETELAEVVTDVEADYLTVLTTSTHIEGLKTQGLTTLKGITFDLIIARTLKICKRMSGYAKKKGRQDLLPLVNHSDSSLRKGTEKEAVTRCKAILDAAIANLTNLVKFKVTEADITPIRQYITTYEGYVNNRTSTTADRTVSGDEMAAIISRIRKNLDILDDLVEGLIDDEGFIARYNASRRIVGYGKGKTLKNTKTNSTAAAKK